MAYEDRILRMVRQKESAPFNDAKDRFRARTKRQRFPGRFPGRALQSQSGGLGSFENQMMMDQNQIRPRKHYMQGLHKKNLIQPMLPQLNFGDEKIYGMGDDEGPYMMPVPLAQPGDSQGAFVGDTDYNSDEKQFLNELNLTGPFGDARDFEDVFTPMNFGGEDTTTGDPAYAAQLENVNNPEFINKYNMFNPRQEGLDYTAPSLEEFNKLRERPRWDNPIGNFFRKFNPFNRGGIASLRR